MAFFVIISPIINYFLVYSIIKSWRDFCCSVMKIKVHFIRIQPNCQRGEKSFVSFVLFVLPFPTTSVLCPMHPGVPIFPSDQMPGLCPWYFSWYPFCSHYFWPTLLCICVPWTFTGVLFHPSIFAPPLHLWQLSLLFAQSHTTTGPMGVQIPLNLSIILMLLLTTPPSFWTCMLQIFLKSRYPYLGGGGGHIVPPLSELRKLLWPNNVSDKIALLWSFKSQCSPQKIIHRNFFSMYHNFLWDPSVGARPR